MKKQNNAQHNKDVHMNMFGFRNSANLWKWLKKNVI